MIVPRIVLTITNRYNYTYIVCYNRLEKATPFDKKLQLFPLIYAVFMLIAVTGALLIHHCFNTSDRSVLSEIKEHFNSSQVIICENGHEFAFEFLSEIEKFSMNCPECIKIEFLLHAM